MRSASASEDNGTYEFLDTVLSGSALGCFVYVCIPGDVITSDSIVKSQPMPIDANKLKENIVIRRYVHRATFARQIRRGGRTSNIPGKSHHIDCICIYI